MGCQIAVTMAVVWMMQQSKKHRAQFPSLHLCKGGLQRAPPYVGATESSAHGSLGLGVS